MVLRLKTPATATRPADKDLAAVVTPVQRRQRLINHPRHMVQPNTTRPVPSIIRLARLASTAPAIIPRDTTTPHPTAKVDTALQTHHRLRSMAHRVRLRILTGNTTHPSPGCLVRMTINPRKEVMASSTSHTIPSQVDSKTPPTLDPPAGNTAHQTLVRPAMGNKTLRIPRILRTPTIVPTPAKASLNILLNTIRHIQVSKVVMTLIALRHLSLLTPPNRAVCQVVIHLRLTVILDMATKDKEDKGMGSKVIREDMGSKAQRTEGLGLLLHRDGGRDYAV